MDDPIGAIRWAPRVSRELVGRLYQSDARGRLDEELLDEVFFGFLARCRSIVAATEAVLGRVACPRCGQVVTRQGAARDRPLRCGRCGWATTWDAYHRTFQGKQLVGGNAIGAFGEFVARAPTARSAADRMLLVDWLIHQVHKTVVEGKEQYWRPAAANLIEGSVRRVAAFLDELAYGAGSTPGVRAEGDRWRDTVGPRLHWRRAPGADPDGAPDPASAPDRGGAPDRSSETDGAARGSETYRGGATTQDCATE